MLVDLNYKQIKKGILFPVYGLPSEEIYSKDGLLLYNNKVVDDRNQKGKTLGIRRLQTPHQKYRIEKIYPEFLDIVRTINKLFIDSNGVTFRYQKTRMCDIVSKRIKKKMSRETYTLLSIEGVNSLYKYSIYPYGSNWAQILYLENLPWLLYSLSENELKTFKKKI